MVRGVSVCSCLPRLVSLCGVRRSASPTMTTPKHCGDRRHLNDRPSWSSPACPGVHSAGPGTAAEGLCARRYGLLFPPMRRGDRSEGVASRGELFAHRLPGLSPARTAQCSAPGRDLHGCQLGGPRNAQPRCRSPAGSRPSSRCRGRCASQSDRSNASWNALVRSCSCSSRSPPRGRTNTFRGTVAIESRLTTDSWSSPLRRPTITSLLTPRTLVVIGATVTKSRAALTASRVSTSTGRVLSS